MKSTFTYTMIRKIFLNIKKVNINRVDKCGIYLLNIVLSSDIFLEFKNEN